MRSFFGRVIGVHADQIVVENSTKQMVVAGAAGVGDWVRLDGLERDSFGWHGRVTIVAPHGGEPFSLSAGEWGRLRVDGRLGKLHKRARALASLRRFFDERGFLEIEAPLLVPSPGLELHLDAFAVEERFLITSPEYQLKRLLAGGLSRVFSVAKCFRRREAGAQHNPEFTMVEWYRSPGAWRAIADDVERLVFETTVAITGRGSIEYQGIPLDLEPPWPSLTVAEAMERYAGVKCEGDEPAEVLAERGRAMGLRVPEDARAWDDIFFHLFLDGVEPHLGRGKPTLLYDWPAPLCALARAKPGDARVVERFEAYAGGLELCNGFGELTDPDEQRARLVKDLDERARRGLPAYPVDEKFLAALAEGLPPCAGVALGFDRLVMLATDAKTLREVVAFTADEL